MKLLHSRLQQHDAVAISAIAGMGGVGKTELATQYARQHEANYPGGICWLNARDTNLAAEIIQFYQFYVDSQREIPQELRGRQLTISEQAIWCWENWQPSEGLILVVWDDVTDLCSCQELLPKNNRFRLLITTRLRNLDPNLVEEIPLDVLSPEKSIELLEALIGQKRVEKEIKTAAELCKWLGHLPLGLELVGRYVADDPDLSLLEMLESLQQQGLDDEALERSTETWTTAQLGVLAAFEFSWQKLDVKTQQVAELLSLFAPDVIPWGLVTSACQRLDLNKADSNKAKKQLYKHYLIQRLEDRNSSYNIHPLIRQFLQVKLELTSSADELKQAFVAEMLSIGQQIPQTPSSITDIELVKDAIPHLKEVAENFISLVVDEDLLWVYTGIGWFYKGKGLYALAEPWLEQCLSTIRQRLGCDHLCMAGSLNNLAEIYYLQGKYLKAESFYKQVLELNRKLDGDEHSGITIALNNLAGCYYLQGRYSKAELLYKQALETYKKLLCYEHFEIAGILSNLALIYTKQGRFLEAETLCQEALGLRKKQLGDEHLSVAQSLNNLAEIYRKQGQYSKAKPMFQKALEMNTKLLGDEHPYIAITLNNLAGLHYSEEEYKKAESLYKRALEINKKLLGNEHPNVAQCLNNLAEVYREQERYTEAEPLFQKALELLQRVLGEEHPYVASSYNNLALLYLYQGRYTEAEPLFQKALQLRQWLLGVKHPSVVTSYDNLVCLYLYQGRYTEAEVMLQKALAIFEQQLGAEHPNTTTTKNNLEYLRNNMG